MAKNSVQQLLGMALVLLSWLTFPGCRSIETPMEPEPNPSQSLLRVGISPTMPPLVFIENGEPAGAEVDFARALGGEWGLEVQLVTLPWEDQIPALQEGKIDIVMSGMSITDERMGQVAYSLPYLRAGQMALVRREDENKYMGFSVFLSTGRVGVERGSTGEQLVRQSFHGARAKAFNTIEEAADALTEGKIDLLVHDAPTIWWLVAQRRSQGLVPIQKLLTEEHLAWAVRSEDSALLDRLNRTLEQWNRDGTLEKIVKRWMPYAE
jgi:polar amino acid transport system substrate-binding protein